MCLPEIHIVHDGDRSFCAIFLEFGKWVTHSTTKTKFDGQQHLKYSKHTHARQITSGSTDLGCVHDSAPISRPIFIKLGMYRLTLPRITISSLDDATASDLRACA